MTVAVREDSSLDLVAAAWGGVVGAIGLMVGTEQGWTLRLGAAAAAFLIGGFLAGVRAESRRRLHAVVATLVAYAIYAAFVAIATVISTAAGPDAPELAPGGLVPTLGVVLWAGVFAVLGATFAERWLRPSRRRAASP